MKNNMKERRSKLKEQADYQKLLRSGECKEKKYFSIPDNPSIMLLRACVETKMTPLHVACVNGNVQFILKIFDDILSNREFSNGGASIKTILQQKTRDGWNLLGLSILHDLDKVFEYIIDKYSIYYHIASNTGEMRFGRRLSRLKGFSVVELAFENESWKILNSLFSNYVSKWIDDIKDAMNAIEKNEKTFKYKNTSPTPAQTLVARCAGWLHSDLNRKQSKLFYFYHTCFGDGMSLKEKLGELSMRQDGQQWQIWIDQIEQSIANYVSHD